MDSDADLKLEDHPTLDLGKKGDVIEALAKYLGFTKQLIESHSRRQEVVRARDLIAYLLREYGDLSYPAIGRLLGGRDHTTIIYSYKKTKAKIEKNPELETELANLIQEASLIKARKLRLEKEIIPEIISAVKTANKQGTRSSTFREIPERNTKVLGLWREGLTLQNIANLYNLSRERIRQIILATIQQMAVNESVSKGIVMDSDLLVEEEFKKRKKSKESKDGVALVPPKEKRWSRYYAACKLCGTTSHASRAAWLMREMFWTISRRNKRRHHRAAFEQM